MTEFKAVVYNHGEGENPHRYSIRFDRFSSLSKTRITSDFYSSSVETLSVHDCVVVKCAIALLTEGAPKVEPDTTHVKHSTSLTFESYHVGQMGHGFVGYKQSAAEKKAGVYDAHTVLIHQNAENEDPDVKRVVENECAMLAYLLNKFRFDNSFISDHAKSCAVGDH